DHAQEPDRTVRLTGWYETANSVISPCRPSWRHASLVGRAVDRPGPDGLPRRSESIRHETGRPAGAHVHHRQDRNGKVHAAGESGPAGYPVRPGPGVAPSA